MFTLHHTSNISCPPHTIQATSLTTMHHHIVLHHVARFTMHYRAPSSIILQHTSILHHTIPNCAAQHCVIRSIMQHHKPSSIVLDRLQHLALPCITSYQAKSQCTITCHHETTLLSPLQIPNHLALQATLHYLYCTTHCRFCTGYIYICSTCRPGLQENYLKLELDKQVIFIAVFKLKQHSS